MYSRTHSSLAHQRHSTRGTSVISDFVQIFVTFALYFYVTLLRIICNENDTHLDKSQHYWTDSTLYTTVPTRDVKTPKFFGPARPVAYFSGPARPGP